MASIRSSTSCLAVFFQSNPQGTVQSHATGRFRFHFPSIVSEKTSLSVVFSDDVKYKASLLPPQAALRLYTPNTLPPMNSLRSEFCGTRVESSARK